MEKRKDIKFRSKLEEYCYDELVKAGLTFEYEPYRVTLIPGFRYEGFSMERKGKKLKPAWIKQQAVTYIPDFVGEGWIIETKGYERPLSALKWKLFKRYLKQNNDNTDLYKPHTKKEVQHCIELILERTRSPRPRKVRRRKRMEFEQFDDGAIAIYKTRCDTWEARDSNGKGLCSGLVKEAVLFWAREALNGYKNSYAIVTNVSFENGYML